MSGVSSTGGRGRSQRAHQQNQGISRGRGIAQSTAAMSARRFEHPETSSSQRLPAQRHCQHVTRGVTKYGANSGQEIQLRKTLSEKDKENRDFTSQASGESYSSLFIDLLKSRLSIDSREIILQHLQGKIHKAERGRTSNIFAFWRTRDFCSTMLNLSKFGLFNSDIDNPSINKLITELLQQIVLKLEDSKISEEINATGFQYLFFAMHFIHAYVPEHRELESKILESLINIALQNKYKLTNANMLTHSKILDALGEKFRPRSVYTENAKELANFILGKKYYKEDQREHYFTYVTYLCGISNLAKKQILTLEEIKEASQLLISKLIDFSMEANYNVKSLRAIGTVTDLGLPLNPKLDQIVTSILSKLFFQLENIDNISYSVLYFSLSALALKEVKAVNLIDAMIYFSNKLNSLEEKQTTILKLEFLTKGTLNWLRLLQSNKISQENHKKLIVSLLLKTKHLSAKHPGKLLADNWDELLISLFIAYHDLELIKCETFKNCLYDIMSKIPEKGSFNRIWRFTECLNDLLNRYKSVFSNETKFTVLINKLVSYTTENEILFLSRKVSIMRTLVSLAKTTSLDFSLFINKFNELASDIFPNFAQLSVEDKVKFIVTLGSVGQAIHHIDNPMAMITHIVDSFSVHFPNSINLNFNEAYLLLRGLMGVHLCLEEIEKIKEKQEIILLKDKIHKYIDDLFIKAKENVSLEGTVAQHYTLLSMSAIWLEKEYTITENVQDTPKFKSQISQWQSEIFNAVKIKYPTVTVDQEISIKGLPEVDIILPDQKIIVEVQGPSHYVANNKDLYLTASLLKKKLYIKLGYTFKEINLINYSCIDYAIQKTLTELDIEFEKISKIVF